MLAWEDGDGAVGGRLDGEGNENIPPLVLSFAALLIGGIDNVGGADVVLVDGTTKLNAGAEDVAGTVAEAT